MDDQLDLGDNVFFDFQIQQIISQGGRVLVHCLAGVSRSASICLAYLTKYVCRSLRESYNLMNIKRPRVRPNLGFWKQLIKFEEVFIHLVAFFFLVFMFFTFFVDSSIVFVFVTKMKKGKKTEVLAVWKRKAEELLLFSRFMNQCVIIFMANLYYRITIYQCKLNSVILQDIKGTPSSITLLKDDAQEGGLLPDVYCKLASIRTEVPHKFCSVVYISPVAFFSLFLYLYI